MKESTKRDYFSVVLFNNELIITRKDFLDDLFARKIQNNISKTQQVNINFE